MFFGINELRQIRADMETLLVSNEARSVSIEYRTYEQDSTENIDEVYNYNLQQIREEPIVLDDLRCIRHIVSERNLRALPYGFMTVGDAMFYFSKTLDFKELVQGYPVIEETIVIIDQDGTRWQPYRRDEGRKRVGAISSIQEFQLSYVMPCKLEQI